MATLLETAQKRFGVVQKAQARPTRNSSKVPALFRPPYGGGAYYGQAYRWEQVFHFKYWAFIAIKAYIKEIAGGEPPNIGEVIRGDERPRKFKSRLNKALNGPREHENFRPYEHNHPLQRVFRNPNGPDVAYDLWAYHTLFLCLTGEAHWWVMRNAFGVPVEIWVIPTHWLRLYTDRDGQPAYYMVQSPWGMSVEVPYDQVVSFYEHSPLNRYEGAAVSQAVGEWIDSYESLIRMRLATFKNNGVPSLHVALGEAYLDPDEAFLNRFYGKWLARFMGEDNTDRPLITGADIEVKGIDGHRPADTLQASNDSEEHIRDMVLAAYGVPKGVVGLEPISDVSAYAPQRAFCRFSINPCLTYMAQVISEKIVKPTPGCEDGILYWDNRVADDADMLERQWTADISDGSATIEEKRAWRGREPYPNGGKNPMINGVEYPWVTGKGESDSEFTQAFNAATADGEPAVKPDGEPDVPANDPNAVNELRSTVGGATALMSLQEKYYAGQLPLPAAISTAVLLFGFSQEEATKLFPGEPNQQQGQQAPPAKALAESAGATGGFTTKCDHGVNQGKPGPCPGPQQADSGSSDSRPASRETETHAGRQAKQAAVKISNESTTPPPPGKAYNPKVTQDADKDGVTDAARVGVPAREVPPPPRIGRLPNLTPHERKVEDEFISAFEKNPDKMTEQFLDIVKKSTKEGDAPTFGTDDAKVLHKAWGGEDLAQRAANRATLNCALHQTANAIAKRAFLSHLDTLKEGDEVMVTVGGCGAGKGYALKNVPQALEMKKRAKAVWDSAGDQNATENPWIQEEAEKRGLKVSYVYVHADPKTQWADPNRGVVKRAGDPNDGRMVDADVFADSYAIGAKNHKAFYERNKNNKNASFIFLQNKGKPELLDGIPEDALKLNRDELATFARDAVFRSDAPSHVKRGATVGARIWQNSE